MDDRKQRLTDEELHALFDQLLPNGFAGADVLGEIAPQGWEQSPFLACFHPSLERVFEEHVQMHRNLESLRRARRRDGRPPSVEESSPEPTLEELRRGYLPQPVRPEEELTELVGQCLWDIFSDNHEVIAADGRVADIGSFRGASAFLDECVNRHAGDGRREGDVQAIRARAMMPVEHALGSRRSGVDEPGGQPCGGRRTHRGAG